MLALPLGPNFNKFPCWLQPKFNGVRCLAQFSGANFVLQSRDEEIWKPNMLTHIREQLLELRNILGTVVLDGELYHHTWKLGRIAGACAVKRTIPNEDTQHLQYIVFDMVHPNVPFSHRYLPVADLLARSGLTHILPTPTRQVYFREEVELAFTEYTSNGFEGVMLRPDVGYAVGKRSQSLYKYKSWDDTECTCIGVVEGTGKFVGMLGALVCQAENGETFEIGTGYDDDDRADLWRNKPIGETIRFKFTEKTERGVYQNPVFLGVLA